MKTPSDTGLFEIVVTPTGDRAYADDPEGAKLAARTLIDEARLTGVKSTYVRAAIYCDGRLVRSDLRSQDV